MEKEEKLILNKILDKIHLCNIRNQIQHTNFFNEEEQSKIEKFLKTNKCNNYIWQGGYENAERKMLIIYPNKILEYTNKEEIEKLEDGIKVIRIILPIENRGKYEHPVYLGAIMKLGIEREKIGDILVSENGADIIIEQTIEKFLISNLCELTRFSKAKMQIIETKDIEIPQIEPKIINITVASMRIDNIVAELAKCSRKIASQYIESECVYINHEVVLKDSKEVKEGDKITIRGKGRFIIVEKLRNTRKDRIVLKCEA